MSRLARHALLALIAVAIGALAVASTAQSQEEQAPVAPEVTVTETVEEQATIEVPLPEDDAEAQQGIRAAQQERRREASRERAAQRMQERATREARGQAAPRTAPARPAPAPADDPQPAPSDAPLGTPVADRADEAAARETSDDQRAAPAPDDARDAADAQPPADPGDARETDAAEDAADAEDAASADPAAADGGGAGDSGDAALAGDSAAPARHDAWSDPSQLLATGIMAFVLMEVLAAGAALGSTRGLVTVPGGVSTEDVRDAAARAYRAARDADGGDAGAGSPPPVTGAALAAAVALAAGATRRRRPEDDDEADGGGSAAAAEEDEPAAGGEVAWAPASELAAGAAIVAIGDRSRTWRWPGTQRWGSFTQFTPPRIAMRSPLVARILADAGYLRAMLGSLSFLTIPAAVALGVAAVADVGGEALPPALALMIAITLLGVADAAAGATAALVFVLGVALLGGIDSAAAVRTLLGVVGVWVTVPLIAGDERPLRRTTRRLASDVFDRLGDVAIAALVCAWVVQGIVGSLGGLAEQELPITASADTMALVVIGALVVRFLLESVALAAYPLRLREVSPDLPIADTRTLLIAAAFRTGLFVFLAVAVIGWSWQLAVGALLIAVRQLVDVFGSPVGWLAPLGRVIPGGITKLVLMLFVGGVYAKFALDALEQSGDPMRDAFVVLALPGFVLGVLGTLAGTMRVPLTWPTRVAGLVVLVVGFLQVQGHLVQF